MSMMMFKQGNFGATVPKSPRGSGLCCRKRVPRMTEAFLNQNIGGSCIITLARVA